MIDDCANCTNAKKHPLSGRYTSGCSGCAARQLAKMRQFHESSKGGRLTPEYRRALFQFFPDLSTADAHAKVREWAR